MSSFSISTGLISGLDFSSLIEAYSLHQQRAIDKLKAQNELVTAKKTAIGVLEANLLTLNSSIQTLGNNITFEQYSVTNSQEQQLKLAVAKTALPGSYTFQAVQKATYEQTLSRGFADASTQTVGAGSLTISQGGFVDQSTLLETLNDGAGVRRGSIRITDRAGVSSVIDLSQAISVDDVLAKINNNLDLSVQARVVDGKFMLEDTSGLAITNLTVMDMNGGQTAADLGIRQSVSQSTLTGQDVFRVTENFNLSQLNDGNQIRLLQGAADIRISLADGSSLEVNLDGSKTLKDILVKINEHTANSGKVTAELENGQLKLTDHTAGSEALQVEDLNNSTVVRQLGLNAEAEGNVLTGQRLTAGMNSVLLRNLRGGQGVTELGEISLTDRGGRSTTVDLAGAETLTDVLEAINQAVDADTSQRLSLKASLNAQGNGIVITDTSGETVSNLSIQDQAGSTLAADLNLQIDAAVTQVNSGSLAMRYVNEATSLANYAVNGGAVQEGMFRITDSNGNVGVITVNSASKNIGDVIQRINANTSISVRAELNETGDGFVLIDEAAGSGTLKVEELGTTTTAADLRLLGTAVTGEDGTQRISSRMVTQIVLEADDTLNDLVKKLNDAGGLVNATTFNDGSTYNPTRLSLTSKVSGQAGRLMIDDGGLGLNFGTIVKAQDAILQVGGDAATAFLLKSATNSFDEVVTGIDVDIKDVGTTAAKVDVTLNTENVKKSVEQMVTYYNQFIDITNELVKFNGETNQRGILQGDGLVLRVTNRMHGTVTSRVGNSNEMFQSLTSLGIRVGEGGKLVLDETRLQNALNNDLDSVKQFFTAKDVGFADKMKAALTSLTDIVDGTLKVETNSIDASVERTNLKITQLTQLMESKKTRLLNQFVAMENTIGKIQSQQTALQSLQVLKVSSS